MRELEFVIRENIRIAENINKMSLTSKIGMDDITCGQFINVSINSPDMLLKRPFGIFSYDKEGKNISFCYQIVGKGTEFLNKMEKGEKVFATLPLGRGYHIQNEQKKIALIGGGAGIFPLHSVFLAYPDKEYHSFLGFRSDCNACTIKEFKRHSQTFIATEDGTLGKKTNAVDLFFDNYMRILPDLILACGPNMMLAALKKGLIDRQINVPAFVSLEERMGCGIGACLVCACAVKTADGIQNKRVCKDGPVFNIMEVEL